MEWLRRWRVDWRAVESNRRSRSIVVKIIPHFVPNMEDKWDYLLPFCVITNYLRCTKDTQMNTTSKNTHTEFMLNKQNFIAKKQYTFLMPPPPSPKTRTLQFHPQLLLLPVHFRNRNWSERQLWVHCCARTTNWVYRLGKFTDNLI